MVELNTNLNTMVGYVLHGPVGDRIAKEMSTSDDTVALVDRIGCPVSHGTTAGASLQSTYSLATAPETSKGFVEYEPYPNKLSSTIVLWKTGMRFVGRTALASGIVAGDAIGVVDGAFAKATAGGHAIGEAIEAGVDVAGATYGTVAIWSFAEPRVVGEAVVAPQMAQASPQKTRTTDIN